MTEKANSIRRAVEKLPLILLPLLIGGCIPVSFSPFYTPKDTVFEPALLGTWGDESSKDRGEWYEVCRSTGDAYAITNHDKLNPPDSKLEGHLTKIGGKLYLDVSPETPKIGLLTFLHYVPVHSIYRISIDSDTLRFAMIDNNWLKDGLKKKTFVLSHFPLEKNPDPLADEEVLITAPTSELRKFVAKHADDPGAFKPSDVMRRIGPCAGEAPKNQ